MSPAVPSGDVTQLIRAWRTGDREAEQRLFEIVLPDLRQMAERFLRRERPDHTLQPTELVSEIYFRLTAARDREWQDRGHFFAIAARAMRHLLIDHARARPDVNLLPLTAVFEHHPAHTNSDFLLNINKLLDELNAAQPELCTIVELKYFLGLTDDEASALLGVGVRTLQRRWQDARRWLFQRLTGEGSV